MQTFDIRDDFPNGFYTTIARIVIAVGRIEYFLKLCVKSLKGVGFSAGMEEAEKLQKIWVLIEEIERELIARGKPLSTTTKDKLKDIEALVDERNDMVHACWTVHPNGVPLRIRPKYNRKAIGKKLTWDKSSQITVAQLTKLRSKLECVARWLANERSKGTFG